MVGSQAADIVTGAVLLAAGAGTLRARPRDPVGWLLVGAAGSWFLGFAVTSEPVLVSEVAAGLLFLHRGLLLHAVVATAVRAGPGVAGGVGGGAWSSVRRLGTAGLVVAGYVSAVRPWATTWLVLVVGAAAAAVAGRALVRARARRARVAWTLVVAGTAVWVLAATALRDLPTEQLAWRLAPYDVGIAASAVGVALARLGARRVADRALRTVEIEGPASLERALAAVLGDDDLRLRLPGVEPREAVGPTAGAAASRLDLGPRGEAVLLHRRGLLDDRPLRRDVEAVVRVVVDEEDLTERVAAATREVQASHDRLVAAEERAAHELACAVEQRVGPRLEEIRAALAALDEPVPRAEALLEEIETELAEVAQGRRRDADLDAALASVAATSTVPARLTLAGGTGTLRADRARALVFVAAEAVANATKHSRAERVEVRLDGDPAAVELRVHDDGRGGAVELPSGGLTGLRTRVEAVDGTLTVSSDAHGTTVVARVPR
ncbi:sensor histidine kinase [Cellulomonas massiliensis]|uniref:sensor histidine kinase n=1 Tax=Cellulomonas massiliensis TaxID=1465811 RepID=UPI0002FD6D5F|nr:sensor histidine kinase [Cellulomonas massiliensis]